MLQTTNLNVALQIGTADGSNNRDELIHIGQIPTVEGMEAKHMNFRHLQNIQVLVQDNV